MFNLAKVMIDIGHLRADSGAVANGVREVDLNEKIGMYCVQALQRQIGIEVTISSGSLSDRSKLENRIRPRCFVSIHNNAGGGDGLEIYTYTNVDKSTKLLAEKVYSQVVPVCNNGRGIKTANFHVLRETMCPSILIECCFLDNIQDLETVKTEEKIKQLGERIAKGICKWLGVSFIENVIQENEKYYRVQCGAFLTKNNAVILEQKLKDLGFNTVIKYY